MKRNYSYFSHKECEFFPCHEGADPEDFNCLFCYCPLYMLGDACGGTFTYTAEGRKDCTDCQFPHKRENYDRIMERYGEISGAMKQPGRISGSRADSRTGEASAKQLDKQTEYR